MKELCVEIQVFNPSNDDYFYGRENLTEKFNERMLKHLLRNLKTAKVIKVKQVKSNYRIKVK